MKKLLILLGLMGMVTTVKAQVAASDRDFIMEQVIHSVSILRANADKAHEWNYGAGVTTEENLNSFQYIRQQADFISVASTGLYHGMMTRKEVYTTSLIGTSAEVMYSGVEDDCFIIKKIETNH